jgi:hypothetical protein
MKKQLILSLILFLSTISDAKENPLQKDISRFIYNADLCEHLAGEVGDQEPSEADILNKNIDIYCGKAQQQFHKLSIKYKNNKKAMKIISNHMYDSVESYHKPEND